MPESVEKLEIWQEAVEIVKTVYDLTKKMAERRDVRNDESDQAGRGR
jgi:hypothetical protein